MRVFSVFDSKAGAYLQPFFSPTDATALRAFYKAVNEPGSMFGQNPGDYTLFEIGNWDEHGGTIASADAKKNLGCAIEMVAEQDPLASVSMARFELMATRLGAIEDLVQDWTGRRAIQGGE